MKTYKKITKVLIIVMGIAIICWICMFSTDCYRCSNLKEPLFVVSTVTADDGGSGIYQGLGYKVELELDGNVPKPQILSVTMTMFNKVVAASIT